MKKEKKTFETAKKSFKKIGAEETFGNSYANTLLVMLNLMLETIKNCKDVKIKENLKNDFIKYAAVLEKVMNK